MQRHALGLLFATLSGLLALIGVAAVLGAGNSVARWLVAVAALAVAAWLASLAVGVFRRR